MRYAYEDLGEDQFETLIVCLCQFLLGISVQPFAKGPDGGRDAKFVGTAERHPSTTAPWVGTTIIQAKHTNGFNKTFSDSDFFSPTAKNTVVAKEIPRIKNLRDCKKLDHYMLFSNRRLGGNAEDTVRDHISDHCTIPTSSIYLCGVGQLDLLLKAFPEAALRASIDPIDYPLSVSPDDLAEVVEAFSRRQEQIQALLNDPPIPRVPYEEKNSLNNMSVEYAKAQRKRFLKETALIESFLAAPENVRLLEMYKSVVDELQFTIISKRKDYQTFDEVMEHIVRVLFGRDPVLRQHSHKPLTRALLFYMYWNCDIGLEPDEREDEQAVKIDADVAAD